MKPPSCCVTGAASGVTVLHVQEGGAVTVPCPTTETGVRRAWYRAPSKTAATGKLLYEQDATGRCFTPVTPN